MLRKNLRLFFSFLLLMQIIAAVPAYADTFCWKDSKGRGVGTIPETCTESDRTSKEAGMCYVPCKPGWEGAATMCLRQCPPNYVNTGLTCHIAKDLLVPANVDVCNMKTSCPSGYTNAGLLCGLNTPSVPAGYEAAVSGPAASGLDLSRQIYDRGIGHAPEGCPSNKENDAGLCYPKCDIGYTGVGPVCWGTCPAGWVNCGASCATSASECGQTIAGQVGMAAFSVASIAALAGTAGTSAAATESVNQSRIAELTAKLNELKAWYKANKTEITMVRKGASAVKKEVELFDKLVDDTTTAEDIARVSVELAGLLDPTGLVSAGAQFVHPTCSEQIRASQNANH